MVEKRRTRGEAGGEGASHETAERQRQLDEQKLTAFVVYCCFISRGHFDLSLSCHQIQPELTD